MTPLVKRLSQIIKLIKYNFTFSILFYTISVHFVKNNSNMLVFYMANISSLSTLAGKVAGVVSQLFTPGDRN